ncbi:unnamed protein product [Parnassius mnemosyne]|uniref:Peptidase S1 domain-containing protein n=1 Tax=Parnassius mnemosyne TaxID=213953 RepID=A0AAV1LF16_9NEOP
MKPLLRTVAAICLILTTHALPENIEDVKELPQSKEPVVEAEESAPQARAERCTSCSSTINLSSKSPQDIIAALQTLPGGAVHTQQSFEGCSSSKGCAGIKYQDGKVTNKFGNLNAFGGENAFKAGSSFGSNLLNGQISNKPFWWMGDNSPFNNLNSGNFETKTSSSGFTSNSGGKGQSTYETSSSSFQSSQEGGIDVANNPFLNGNINFGQSGFAAGQGSGFASGSQGAGSSFQSGFGTGQSTYSGSGSNKFSGAGYTGSSPRPFATSTGSNVNLIQNTQKVNEYDFDQTQQAVNGDIFSETSNVNIQGQTDGDLQQTCTGQGYVCVLKSQCINGIVNTNGAGILQTRDKKQFCNTRTETCCRIGSFTSHFGNGFSTADTVSQGSGLVSNTASSFSSGSYGSSSNSQKGSSGSQSSFGSQNSFGTNGNQGSYGSQSGSNGASSGFGSQSSSFNSQSNYDSNRGSFGTNYGSTVPAVTAVPVGSTGAFGSVSSAATSGFLGSTGSTIHPEIYKATGQSNFVETNSFASQSNNQNVYRPGTVGSGLKPGVPYLPPVDSTNSGTNVVGSTVYPSTFTTPRPVTQFTTVRPQTPARPVSTPRPFTTPRPTYLPPVSSSTAAPGYLPPVGEQTINQETFVPNPNYNEGGIILDETRQPSTPRQPTINEIPSGCAAALKCTPIEYCTADGVISNTTVILTKDQEAYRVPLTDCKDLETNRVGKCCRDPNYSDPWPTNQLGKWVPGVFGGNDGKYVPDNRGSPNNPRPQVTQKPFVTGSTILNNFRNPKPTSPTFGANQVTPGYPDQGGQTSTGIKQVSQYGQGQYSKGGTGQFGQGGVGQVTQTGVGQYGQKGVGQVVQTGVGQFGQAGFGQKGQVGFGQFGQAGVGKFEQGGVGQYTQSGFGQYSQGGRGQVISQGTGQLTVQGQGQIGVQGQGVGISQGGGAIVSQGQGQFVKQGEGQGTKFGVVTQGFGQRVETGGGQYTEQGGGQYTQQGVGQATVQGGGVGIRQGVGLAVSQGVGSGVENEYSASTRRVYLQRYDGTGQCGIKHGQRPYGNREDDVAFAEIPWQAMVLLQTNKSLLCGGVITRPDVVVTSAACVDGLEAKNVLIKGGEWKLGIEDEPLPYQIVQVKTIVVHPGYQTGSLQYDVAILYLAENLRLADNIQPICMPDAKDTLDAFYSGAGQCIVTGWGKQVLQAHLSGSLMHSINVSLIEPTQCEAKIQQNYPHLLDNYDQESCICGEPSNPLNNICRVDIGSALACTTGDGYFVLQGVYSWDSGCQTGNQLAAFYKFDIEWYEWAIGLTESVRFTQFVRGTKVTQTRYTGQITSGTKGTTYTNGIKGTITGGLNKFGGQGQFTQFGAGGLGQFTQFGAGQVSQGQSGSNQASGNLYGQSQYSSSNYSQFSTSSNNQYSGSQNQFASGNFGGSSSDYSSGSSNFGTNNNGPSSNSFSSTYTEKQFFQTEPKYYTFTTKPEIVTYTTKPEIVTFTTKPEIFTFTTKPKIITYTTKPKLITYTTKPKIVTYTTKPQFITYETSGSGTNPQYVAPGASFKPTFSEIVGTEHKHNAQCKCLENGKK